MSYHRDRIQLADRVTTAVELSTGPVPHLLLLREQHHLVALRDTEQESQDLFSPVPVGVDGHNATRSNR